MPGVYISYPFCNQKCTFCNFASGVAGLPSRLRYEEVLQQELSSHVWQWEPESVFFGGGTPSLMPLETLNQLLAAIPSNALVESTLECAPGTLTEARVAGWVRSGINRISLGVQSFDLMELRHSGRRHSAETVANDLALLRSAGIGNVNVDLIAGLPHQTMASWTESLTWIERLCPPHVSVYLFEIDENSRLGKEILDGGSRYSAGAVPRDDVAADFYEFAVDRLAGLGYKHYEISNFAHPGLESQHNLKYWRLEPYVGFGMDAHSYDGRSRWNNPDNLADYFQAFEACRIPGEFAAVDHEEEHFFVGLRLMDGIKPSMREWERFAVPIQKWTERGILQQVGNTLRLSPHGVLISNEVFQEFLNV